jgi:hypothetical protein
MSIIAVVEKDTIKLPVHVPDGTRVEIVLPERAVSLMTPEELGKRAERLAGENDPARAEALVQEFTVGFYGEEADA